MSAPGNAGTIYRGEEGVNNPRSVGQTYLPLGKTESLGKAQLRRVCVIRHYAGAVHIGKVYATYFSGKSKR